jgi:hypothetical protein
MRSHDVLFGYTSIYKLSTIQLFGRLSQPRTKESHPPKQRIREIEIPEDLSVEREGGGGRRRKSE